MLDLKVKYQCWNYIKVSAVIFGYTFFDLWAFNFPLISEAKQGFQKISFLSEFGERVISKFLIQGLYKNSIWNSEKEFNDTNLFTRKSSLTQDSTVLLRKNSYHWTLKWSYTLPLDYILQCRWNKVWGKKNERRS